MNSIGCIDYLRGKDCPSALDQVPCDNSPFNTGEVRMSSSRITCALLVVVLLCSASLQAETRRAGSPHLHAASMVTPDYLMADDCCEPAVCCDPCGPRCCVNPIPAILGAIDGAITRLLSCNACCDPCCVSDVGKGGVYDDAIITDPMPPDPFIDDPIDPSVMRGAPREINHWNAHQPTAQQTRPSRRAHASIRSDTVPRRLSVRQAAPLVRAESSRIVSSRRATSAIRAASSDRDLEVPANPLRP
jgi:hypothetical protein